MTDKYLGDGVQPANKQGCKMCIGMALGIMDLHEECFSTGPDRVDDGEVTIICAYKSDEEFIQAKLDTRGGSVAVEMEERSCKS